MARPGSPLMAVPMARLGALKHARIARTPARHMACCRMRTPQLAHTRKQPPPAPTHTHAVARCMLTSCVRARRASQGFFKGDDAQHDLSLNEVLAYRFQQIITGSTATKLGFVLLLCMPYVLASATFYRSLSSESWFQAIYKTYCTLFRTPGSVNRETAAGPAIVLNVVFLYGAQINLLMIAAATQHATAALQTLQVSEPGRLLDRDLHATRTP
jgi:hypothetical protein